MSFFFQKRYTMRRVGTKLRLGDGTQFVFKGKAKDQIMAYRYAMMARTWGMTEHRPATGQQRVPAAPPPPPPKEPERLVLPLFITREEKSQRSWDQALHLVERINSIFAPAKVTLELFEPGECETIPEPQGFCPFAEELDHAAEFLHVALVADLPGDQPQLASCGRCCLIPDRCDDRSAARAVAQLLGLTPVRNVNITERLMSTSGSGLELSPGERQWLRWHAGTLIGVRLPISDLKIPVWAYAVEGRTRRTEPELRQILDKVNVVWEQAGMGFELVNWCHLREDEFKDAALQGDLALLAPVVSHAPRSLHLFLVDFPGGEVRSDFKHGLALIPDELKGSRTWALGRAFGLLLGLSPVAGEDQLMGPNDEGFRLHALEIVHSRGQARLQLERTNPTQVAARPAPVAPAVSQPAAAALEMLTVPVRLHLVRGNELAATLTPDGARQLVADANAVWASSGVRCEVQSLHEPSLSLDVMKEHWPTHQDAPDKDRKPTWTSLGGLSGYDPRVLNIFLVKKIKFHGRETSLGGFQYWRGHKVLVVAEEYPKHTLQKQLALSLGLFWGLTFDLKGPVDRLTSWQTPGTTVTPAERDTVRAGLAGPDTSAAAGLEVLSIPVRVNLAACPFNLEQALAVIDDANSILAAAGLRVNPVSLQTVTLPPGTVEATFSTDTKVNPDRKVTCRPLTELDVYDPRAVNLFWTHKITYHTGHGAWYSKVFKSERVLVAATEYHGQPPTRTFARAIVAFLGLSFAKEHPESQLTSYAGTKGVGFSEDEVKLARKNAQKLLEALSGDALLEGLDDLTLPVRLIAVSVALERAREMAAEARDIWAQASVRLAIDCKAEKVSDETLSGALPNDPGDTTRKRNFKALTKCAEYRADSVNVFLLDELWTVGRKTTFVSSIDRSDKCIVLGKDAIYSPGKMLARALGIYFFLENNDYAPLTHLMAQDKGTLFSQANVARVRKEIARLFPEKKLDLLTLKLKVILVRNPKHGTTLTPERLPELLARANEWWQPAGIALELAACEMREVPDATLEEAFPNPPGSPAMRMPMGFGLMALAGLNPPGTATVFVVREVPHAVSTSFAQPGIMLMGEGALAPAVAQFLGISGTDSPGPEAAQAARAKLQSRS